MVIGTRLGAGRIWSEGSMGQDEVGDLQWSQMVCEQGPDGGQEVE